MIDFKALPEMTTHYSLKNITKNKKEGYKSMVNQQTRDFDPILATLATFICLRNIPFC